jgi:tellurite resistance protein
VVSGLVFGLLLLAYALKALRHLQAVIDELSDPVKMSFGVTVTVSLVLLSITTLQLVPAVSKALWVTGAALHLAYTLYVLNTWIHKSDFDIKHISPAWFIPVVGNILVPVAGAVHASAEISWFFFSIGLLFWLVLFTIIIYRMIFHHPLPDKLLPTLFILIAPPAVGFISYLKLAGGLDGFARVLYFSALFLTLLLFLQIPRFLRLPFYLSWWAYSFPLAAMTVATLLMHSLTALPAYAFFAWLLLGVLYVVVVYLIARTLYAVARREICIEGH